MKVMVSDRTLEIRPSEMTRGSYGDVGDGMGYTGTYRGNAETAKLFPNAACGVVLSKLQYCAVSDTGWVQLLELGRLLRDLSTRDSRE